MKRRWWSAGIAVGAVFALAACSGGAPASTGAAGQRIAIVASTNVWGDIAASVGGDHVEVTSIIDDPSKDPHEYQADARTQLALSEAQLVVRNGGGYDDFVDTMRSASPSSAPMIDAVEVSGKTAPAGGELNEHVWYDLPTVAAVATEIATQLGTLDPANAASYTANAQAFGGEIATLQTRSSEIAAQHAGDGVAITEPVPLYLFEAMGLENRTPAAFSEGVEEDTDIPATVLQETEALFDTHQVKLLAYNEQTSGASTDVVLAAAQRNSIPAIAVTETLPADSTYLAWMGGYIDEISQTLGD